MVFTNSQELQDHLQSIEWNGKNLLFMSSGNFGGIDVDDFGPSLI
jgi:UDP-N-acetylmuramate: L-alanyl-gamma-D-glutamyl-meso-diaminopimelate ligase